MEVLVALPSGRAVTPQAPRCWGWEGLSRARGAVGVPGLTPLHPHLLSDSAPGNPKSLDGGHSSQEVKSETSSNPSSPEICPNKEK